jgi:hypothetical protein
MTKEEFTYITNAQYLFTSYMIYDKREALGNASIKTSSAMETYTLTQEA